MKKIISCCLAALLLGFVLSRTESGTSADIHYENRAIVLLYHDIVGETDPRAGGPSTLTGSRLEEHLRMLAKRGFRIVAMDEFVRWMQGRGTIPPNAVVLTFDDGYESFYTHAAPVLKRFGATASNFVVGISTDLYNPDADPHMSWEQMRRLKREGMGFYSHTYDSHRTVAAAMSAGEQPALTSRMKLARKGRPESEDEYRRRIVQDMEFMEKRLREELGEQPKLLAFPYGAYDEKAVQAGEEAGIELFFTIEEGLNAPGSRFVKRINAGEPYMTADLVWNRMKTFFDSSKVR
ncbi:polysaccharide deacetylase family protein [Paenibacillus flagellatus]|uniref:Polysaccharide deacetylase n=1 Tax=Paenibacillus flagellatus TaxID=2211139 RepID=A0A2V5K0H6_9BACL|nr:polysaccharide deacetylase family protein [Paenibacillus flagellatus]PYI52601.1 polysaccharide deacetylase [Paenibacillus flagellatus]